MTPREWLQARGIDPRAAPPQSSPPSLSRRAWSLASSLAAFVADGCRTVTRAQYAARLAICDTCPDRAETRCRMCGCNLSTKARGRAFQCPAGRWPHTSSDPTPSQASME